MTDTENTQAKVYKAGGGGGNKKLHFDVLAVEQRNMFDRTISLLSKYQIAEKEQELRQITLRDKLIQITVSVAREDFPLKRASIDIQYYANAAQQAWSQFLKDVCTKLQLDFIHSILDRKDQSPIHRILMMRDKGDYLIRQREESAILEVINTGIVPLEISWEITRDIIEIKKDLAFNVKTLPHLNSRVAELVSRPLNDEDERILVNRIIGATHPSHVVELISNFYLTYEPKHEQEEAANDKASLQRRKKNINFAKIDHFINKVDIISIHRLGIESLNRFVDRRHGGDVVDHCLDHVLKVVDQLMHEVDLIAVALKLISDLSKLLVKDRDKILPVILNCMQAYCPTSAAHRVRKPKRLEVSQGTSEEMIEALLAKTTAATQFEEATNSRSASNMKGKEQVPVSTADSATEQDLRKFERYLNIFDADHHFVQTSLKTPVGERFRVYNYMHIT